MTRWLKSTTALVLGMASVIVLASPEPPAQSIVRMTTDRVLDTLRQDPSVSENRQRVYGLVNEIVVPHFDMSRMSRRVLGKAWRTADESQQTRFMKEFQTLLIRTYATALASYTDQVIEYLPAKARRKPNEISIRTQIVRSGSPAIPINYEMHMQDEKWKIFDVAIDGVSLVINYRSTFRSEIRKNGLDGLIERLAKHNLEKSGASK